jgi:hypothetical protein
LPANATVNVYGTTQQAPTDAKLIGSLFIGDSGFTTKCNYAQVIEDAQNQARAMGGNIIVITKHKEPSIWGSSCHRITAEVYKTTK